LPELSEQALTRLRDAMSKSEIASQKRDSSAEALAAATVELVNYDPRRLAGVSVYREVAHEFSAGDRIQFTAPDNSLGIANRVLGVIESFALGGRISARLDNNRQIEFDPVEHRHFDHGYAVTSHSSQGLTAERVLVNADTGVHPDLLNSRFGYVAISRASHEAILEHRSANMAILSSGERAGKPGPVAEIILGFQAPAAMSPLLRICRPNL
jgi:ATP-dependent exoDNAse (exonuclease V) alpha subunit